MKNGNKSNTMYMYFKYVNPIITAHMCWLFKYQLSTSHVICYYKCKFMYIFILINYSEMSKYYLLFSQMLELEF